MRDNISKTYKNSTKLVNLDAKKIIEKLLISERFQNYDAYLTIKDRKECFPHNRSFSHIPVKLEKPFWTK